MKEFDVQKFIELVRQQRVIYDVNIKVPNKKKEVERSWLKIASEMTQNFKDMQEEKRSKCEKLKKTWKSMFDNMRRTVKSKKHTYVHYKEMEFVIPHLGRKWKSANRRNQECRNGTSQWDYNQLPDHIKNKRYLLSLLNNMTNTDYVYIMDILGRPEFVSTIRMFLEFTEDKRTTVLANFISNVQEMHVQYQNESDLHNLKQTGCIAPLSINTGQNEMSLIDATILNTRKEDVLTTPDSLVQIGSGHSEHTADTFCSSDIMQNDGNILVSDSSPYSTASDLSIANSITRENYADINNLQNTDFLNDLNPEYDSLNPTLNTFGLDNLSDKELAKFNLLDYITQCSDMSVASNHALLDKNVDPLLSSVQINSMDT